MKDVAPEAEANRMILALRLKAATPVEPASLTLATRLIIETAFPEVALRILNQIRRAVRDAAPVPVASRTIDTADRRRTTDPLAVANFTSRGDRSSELTPVELTDRMMPTARRRLAVAPAVAARTLENSNDLTNAATPVEVIARINRTCRTAKQQIQRRRITSD